ncbi:MAG: hypothetical protein MJY61_02050 [Bacteroidales bacterium]|nr:hypothetical protein [Bacteroidales bacterium]
MHSKNRKYGLCAVALFAAACSGIFAQVVSPRPTPLKLVSEAAPSDSSATPAVSLDSLPETVSSALRNLPDSLVTGVLDSSSASGPDSLAFLLQDSAARFRQDSLDLLAKSSLDNPAFSVARDSIVEVLDSGRRLIYYYGDVTVTHKDMKLTADYMEYDLNSGVLYARGVYDTLNKEWKGLPVMTQGNQSYKMEGLHYNFNTRKARIDNMITDMDDALLHGKTIKMQEDQSVNMTKGKYTVCDLEHPHYYLALSSAKVMTKPKQKTVFGPACLVVEDVPLYFVGLPFGFIPQRPKRATGILMPTFGEEEARGFYMRDAGLYFVLGDYFDFSITGDYYTMGSWAVDFNSRYKVNYKFSGNIGLSYSKDITGEKGSADYNEMSNFSVKWSHSQDSKARPGTSFSASVNFSSPSNNRYNMHSLDEALNNQIGSSISYSRNWNGKVNLSINALHSQNTRDSSYHFSLPNISFSISTFYPFKRKERVGKERFYERFSLGYNTSFTNNIDFKAKEFGQPGFFDKFQSNMTHNFSIGLPNFTLLKYITFAPSFSYNQRWYFRKTEYEYDAETNQVVPIQGGQFQSFGIFQTYSMGASLNTRLYGMYNFTGKGNLMAIRHVLTPSLSASWNPDLKTYANGFRTLAYMDAEGNEKTYEYNLYGQSASRQSASLNFSFDNNLEAKVRDPQDTTGTGNKKVKLIDNFRIGGNYNFMADSMRLSTISMSLSTNLFNKVNLSASASFDPYAITEGNKRYNRLAVACGQGLMRLQTMNLSMSYSLTGKGEVKGDDGSTSESAANYYERRYYHPYTNEFIPGGWLYYTNPNVPWSVNLSYSLNLSMNYSLNEGKLETKPNLNHYLNVTGNVKLTPKLSLNLTTGFDFTNMKLSPTQLNATYDLHCFNISFMWIPMGTYKSYSFRIAANSATLSDLLRFRKSNSWRDN